MLLHFTETFSQDYRFMPEPNLPPLHLLIDGYELPKDVNPKDVVNVECIRKEIPEMPQETRKMLKDKFGLSSQTAVILVVIIIVFFFSSF